MQCNGEVLRSVDGFRYTLNEALAQAVNRIDVELGQHRVAAMLFVLSDGWRWGEGAECPAVDRYGGTAAANGSAFSVRGALVSSADVPDFVPDAETIIEENEGAVLLGCVPGQVADLREGSRCRSGRPCGS